MHYVKYLWDKCCFYEASGEPDGETNQAVGLRYKKKP